MPRLLLLLLPLLAACQTGKVGGDGDGDPDDSGTSSPQTDECDDAPGRVLCQDGQAITCDDDGDVLSTVPCSESEVCQEDAGCLSCAVSLDTRVGSAASMDPLVRLQPERADVWEVAAASMRPLVLSADEPALVQGGVVLSVEGEGVALWTEDGQPVDLEEPVAMADLPRTLLVQGLTDGAVATVAATPAECGAEPAALDLRVAPWRTLAGRSLTAWPWLYRVDAFTVDEQPQVGIEPGLHGDLSGLSADLYVVAHRDADAWAADPALVDAGDGAESITLLGGSLEDQRFTVWASDLPTADAQVGLGFDVVLDVDGDGQLSPGDLFDGVGTDAPAFWVLGDLTREGPHDVTTDEYSGGSWRGQRLYYPSDVADLSAASGPLPLVVISHGNGHDYRWYDYLGEHLASWGYVVMSHQNNTGPGIDTASNTTLSNTDWFLQRLDSIADGELDGRVDSHRITWIGHSRGGEGVARAYDKIVDGVYDPLAFEADDIVLISSIAPTVFLGVTDSDPHDTWYHLIAGGADGDVSGGPYSGVVQYLRIAEAAEAQVAVTYVQGASHNDFNCCGFDDGTGPDLIGRTRAQDVAKSTYLALLEWVVQGNPAPAAFFRRPYESFHDSALSSRVIVANQWRPDPVDAWVIDDFQDNTALDESSSGGAVDIDASDAVEGRMDDADSSFGWDGSDAFNTMTLAEDSDDRARGLIIGWDEGEEASVRFEVPEAGRDFSTWRWLSLRAAQTSRHPLVMALDDVAVFSVVLEDGAGTRAVMALDTLGLSLTNPYPRTSYGSGFGWASEWTTLRLPLQDFLADGGALDLSDVVAVELRFGTGSDGTPWGDAFGRVAVDDLMLVED
ncbi:MAG: hypothetical protein H6742_19750 [Alphaproteobacteria bacterium]|nr:hypothetical protein [Alphaproteobacteria bacterium]